MSWTKKVIHLGYYLRTGNEYVGSRKERLPIILPPLPDRCQVCGRHISKLKPFGGFGDPVEEDFTGEKLVMTWRPCRRYQMPKGWVDSILKNKKWNIDKTHLPYEEDIDASCECRDCIVLSHDECEKLMQSAKDSANRRKGEERWKSRKDS